jgi:hypothetical protein
MVYKLDRAARSMQDLLTILDQIKAAGALVSSLTEPLDTTIGNGRICDPDPGGRCPTRTRHHHGAVHCRLKGGQG